MKSVPLLHSVFAAVFITATFASTVSAQGGGSGGGGGGGASSGVSVECQGMSDGFDDIYSNIDWDNAWPISIATVAIGDGDNPPRMGYDEPLCECNWRIPFLSSIPYGLSFSFWAPMYITEVVNRSGCMLTTGEKTMSGYEAQTSGKGGVGDTQNSNQRRQVHFFIFAIFKLLDLFAELFCSAGTKGFDLAYMTEVDSTWQSDIWSTGFFPESSLFANVGARVACMVEAAKINIGQSYNIDAMWWCLGNFHLYPVTGNDNTTNASENSNMKALGRFLYKQHRTSMLSTHIGSSATCFSHYSPRLPKQQYRIDPLIPEALDDIDTPIVPGRNYLFWTFPPPIFNYATKEHAGYMLWRGTQCCLRL